jgi:uncharacterized OB-fold protein
MTVKKQIPIDPELFSWPSEAPRLNGSQCLACENITFPTQASCPKCCGTSMKKIELSAQGTLWTWTSQEFRPKSPYKRNDTVENFKPFYVGYVELPGQLRVQTRLGVEDASQLKIGMEMELEIVPYRIDDDGNEVMIYSYKPSGGGN